MIYFHLPWHNRILGWGYGLLALSTLAGCNTESNASNRDKPLRTQVSITITDRGCDVAEITTPAGKTKFTISNRGVVPLEWEILDGVKVVEEIENVLPGTKKDLKTTLDVGNYLMLCGKKTTKERTKLIVTANN